MKFSRRSYPILQLIEERNFSRVDIFSSFTDEIKQQIFNRKDTFNGIEFVKNRFTELDNVVPHICYFVKGIFQKASLLAPKLEFIINDIPNSDGIFLLPDKSVIIYKWQNQTLETIHIAGTEIIELASLESVELYGAKYMAVKRIPENGISIDGKNINVSIHQNEGTLIPWLTLVYLAFYHFAEIETKIISSENLTAKVIHNNEKYYNDTKSRIEIIDSNWFTKIIRTTGFKVSGHFKFQPYGSNFSKRKLVWIDEYQKDGYTKNERILRN